MDFALAFERSLRVVPPPSARRVVEPEDIYDSIDPLLEKISIRHRQPDRERAARAGPRAQPPPEQIQVTDR